MDTFRQSRRILKRLDSAAGGSFSVVYHALDEALREQGGGLLDADEVEARIRGRARPLWKSD